MVLKIQAGFLSFDLPRWMTRLGPLCPPQYFPVAKKFSGLADVDHNLSITSLHRAAVLPPSPHQLMHV